MSASRFSLTLWAWLVVRDDRDVPGYDASAGVSARLMYWMQEARIDWRAQRTGGGAFVGRVPVEDMERVRAWLEVNGSQDVGDDL